MFLLIERSAEPLSNSYDKELLWITIPIMDSIKKNSHIFTKLQL